MMLFDGIKSNVDVCKKAVKAQGSEVSRLFDIRNIARSAFVLCLFAISCGSVEEKKNNKMQTVEKNESNKSGSKSIGVVQWGGKLGEKEAFIQYSFTKPISKVVISRKDEKEPVYVLENPEVGEQLKLTKFELDDVLKKGVLYTTSSFGLDGKEIPVCYEAKAEEECVEMISKELMRH